MTPTPSDLSYFVEVANILNLSRAAETLGISQPSLTLAMRRLEKSVGTPLLVRHQHGVSLTKAGMQLLAHTRQLLQQWDTIKSQALASMHDIQGSFTIGCHTSLGMHALPRFLAPLLEKNPRLEIKLQHDSSRKITEQVIQLQIDIGLVVNPTKHLDLIVKHLDDDKVTLFRSKSINKNNQFNAETTILLCDPDLLQTQSILKKMKKTGLMYQRIIPSNSLEVIADLTESGCGIGILPANVAAKRKLIRLAKSPVHQDEICLVYRGENREVKAIQVITDAIKKAFSS